MNTALCRALPILLCLASPALGYDAFSDTRSPPRFALEGADGTRLILKGQTGFSWRDLEGTGGLGHDSTTDTATLGTRSPHFALGSARLAVRVELPGDWACYSAFAFSDLGARLESAWLDYDRVTGPWRLTAEVGLNQPFVADDWQTARPPLADRIYWGQSEAHIVAQGARRWGDTWISVGLSAAMMRPLESTPINDASQRRGTISVLAYGPARPFSGNRPIVGGRVGVEGIQGRLEIFGYVGALTAAEGTDALRNRIGGFSLLPNFNADDPRRQEQSAWWAGGRGTWRLAGLEVKLEGIRSRESLLFRHLVAGQLGYVWAPGMERLPATLELRLRAETYAIEGGGDRLSATRALRSPDPSQAITWDHQVYTVALATQIYPRLLWLRAEHSIIEEDNGAPGLGRANSPINNNETTLDLELRF